MRKSLLSTVQPIRHRNITPPAWLPIAIGALVQACSDAEPGQQAELASAVIVGDPLADCSVQTPTGCLTKRKPAKMQRGFTYIDTALDQGRGLPNQAFLIDSRGNLVHTWDIGFGSKVLPDGHVIGGLPYPDAEGKFVGSNLDCLMELDWDNNVVWPPHGATVIGGNGGRFCDPSGQ